MRIRRDVTIAAAAMVAIGLLPAVPAMAGDVAACSGRDLTGRVTGTGAGMSQPAVYITVTNVSGGTCLLSGYPAILRLATRTGAKPFAVTEDAVMNATHPAPHRIALRPGQRAFFALGAATAYDLPPVTFRRVTFAPVPGATPMTVRIALPASRDAGQPFPLGITAYQRGVGTTNG